MKDERPDSVNDEEFRALYQEHLAGVIALFRRRGFTAQEARDLAQDTFLRAFHGWETWSNSRESSFKTWVHRIAANVWRNELRARGAQKREGPRVSLDDAPEIAASDGRAPFGGNGTNEPFDVLWNLQRRELVHRALRELPPQMQRCMLLHVSGDLKYREIAAAMDISIGAVKSQLHEARERLKSRLGRFLDNRGFESVSYTPDSAGVRGGLIRLPDDSSGVGATPRTGRRRGR